MPNFAEAVSFTLIGITVAAIFAIVGIGIFLVKKFK
jgi:hypothetical protein